MPIYKSLVRKVSIPAQNKIKQKDYLPKGAYPVIDQGHELIGGYTDDPSKLVRCRLPVIVFGDHTKAVKYITFPFAAGADGIKVLEVTEGIDPRFLFYATKFLIYKIENKGYARHYQFVEKKDVSIPELPEQQRIVARIEELFSQLDDAEATLQKAKAQLALYNQAVLHSIFNTANGSKEYAIEEICESIVDCPHSTPKWISHGKLCLRTTNFRRGYLDLSEPNYVSEETFERRNARLVPMPGDILYSREGAILGIACIIPEDTYVCLGQRMMLLRTNRKVLNKYLMYYLNSPAVTTLIGNKTGGSASPHINVGDIKKIRIPVPEFEQQEKLVAQIESRLSLCKEIEQTISILLLKLTSCKQSVLNTEIKGDDKNEQRNYRL